MAKPCDAMTYATTAGPEYLHQALERAIRHKEAYVALHIVEALGIVGRREVADVSIGNAAAA